MDNGPFVSVVTPVFNGEAYLAEAIESVLSQSYRNWEYVIVDNRSTDNSRTIADSYARLDPRIRVVTTPVHVGCEENHNNAFREISRSSLYCKVLSADDWLLPQALSKLLDIAMRYPRVGIVGSYQESAGTILWKGLPPDIEVVTGRDICRMCLLDQVYVLGAPTSVLYRSDILRRTRSFFPHDRPHADTSACFIALQHSDFGFVHEVLSVERIHGDQESSRVKRLDADVPALIELLLEHGPHLLAADELARRRREMFEGYYWTLARAIIHRKGKEYWSYHRSMFREFGEELNRGKLAIGLAKYLSHVLRHPRSIVRGLKAPSSRSRSA